MGYAVAPNSEITVDANGNVTSAIVQFVGQTTQYSLSVAGSSEFQNLGSNPQLSQFVLFGSDNHANIVISTTALDLTNPQWTGNLFPSQDYLFNPDIFEQYSALNLTIYTFDLGAALNGVDVSNSGVIQIDGGTALTLNEATIGGGTIDNSSTVSGTIIAGDIDIVGSSTINGNASLNGGIVTVEANQTLTLDNVTVSGTAFFGMASGAMLSIDATDTLTLQNGAIVTGGGLTDSGKLQIESSTGATLDGVMVTGATGPTASLIDVGTTSAATLLLDDGTTITNGRLTIGSNSTLDVESSAGATLDNVTVTGPGTIQVNVPGQSTPATLNLDGGTSITGGNFSIGSVGTVFIEAGTASSSVTLDGVTVTNNNILTIDLSATLTLDGGTEIIGGTITDNGNIDVTGNSSINGTTVPVATNALLNNGAVTVESGVTLTLDNVTVTGTTITDPGTIKVESGKTLTLAGTDTITGGQFTFGQGRVAQAGPSSVLLSGVSIGDLKNGNPQLTLTITPGSGSVALVSATGLSVVTGVDGVIAVTGALADIEAALNTGLTLSNSIGTSTTLTMSLDDGAGHTAFRELTINTPQSGPPTFQVTDASGAIRNANLIDITGTTTLSSDSLFNGSSTLKVESGALLKLADTGTHGGTITDDGTVEITAESGINNGDLNIGLNGVLLVDSGELLTLRNSTVTSGTVTDNGTIEITSSSAIKGAKLANFQLTVDSGQTLTLHNTSVTGGTVTDNGTIDVSGISSINGTTTSGPPVVTTNAILENGAVTVESGATLTLDNVTVNGTVFTDLATGSTIQIDSGDTLVFNGATINGGTLNVFGELDSTGTSLISGATIVNSSHIDVVSGMLTIDPTLVTNTGTIEVKGDSTLVLSDDTITNSVTIASGTTIGIIQVDATDLANSHFSTLDLDNSTIHGGQLTISGELVSTGNSSITGVAITNSGIIDVTSGTLTIDATSTFNNAGTLELDGGKLIIDAALSGNLEIKGGAVLELGNSSPTAYSSATVTFDPASTGTLQLDYSPFGGTISGFGAGKTIDLADLAYSTSETDVWSSATNTLTITSGSQTETLKLAGTYTQSDFALTNDANNHTEVVWSRAVASSVSGLDNAGNADAGKAVTALLTDSNAGSLTYTWLENGQIVPNASNQSFTPGPADIGKTLDVVVRFSDGGVTEQVTALAGTVVNPVVANNDAIANPTAPGGWSYDPENGHYYKYVAATTYDWNTAMAAAAADNGAYLANITSGAENVFVSQLLPNGATAWTGGQSTQDQGPSAVLLAQRTRSGHAVYLYQLEQRQPAARRWRTDRRVWHQRRVAAGRIKRPVE